MGCGYGLESARGQGADLLVTNISQFRGLSGGDFLSGCPFRVTGVVTLVDTNRNLVALQDETGAVALNLGTDAAGVSVGERVEVEASNCSPYVAISCVSIFTCWMCSRRSRLP